MNVRTSQLHPFRTLHLFAGAGGGILADLLLGHQPVCAVEINNYCQQALAQRQADGCLPWFPVYPDVTTFDGRPWRGLVECVSGGFPCQDISSAGKGVGITGARSGLWSEFARIICEVRPRYAFIENSPNLTTRGLDVVLSDLASMGFDAEWGVVSAADAGAPHRRDRIWVLGRNTNGNHVGTVGGIRRWSATDSCGSGEDPNPPQRGLQGRNECLGRDGVEGDIRSGEPERVGLRIPNPNSPRLESTRGSGEGSREGSREGSGEGAATVRSDREPTGASEDLADTERQRQPAPRNGVGGRQAAGTWQADQPGNGSEVPYRRRTNWWATEPQLGRVAHGVANRVERLRAIGNGQVPQSAALAWRILWDRINNFEQTLTDDPGQPTI